MSQETKMIPVVIYRGGTSKGIFIREYDLPVDPDQRDTVIRAIFGSPDKRQIDGLGGADALTSKLAIIGPPSREDADVDYNFAQVDIMTPTVYYGAVCGNITAAVGPYAIEEGFVTPHDGETEVRVHAKNIGRIIRVTVPTPGGKVTSQGDFNIDGVPGTGARIDLNWSDTVGAKTGTLLPTGNARDTITVPGLGTIEVSIVDVGNVGIFVRATDLGLQGTESPEMVDADPDIIPRCDAVANTVMQQIDNIAFLTFVSPPAKYTSHVSGEVVPASASDLLVRMIFLGSMHKTYAASQTNCCGAAAMIPGSIVNEAASEAAIQKGYLRLGHPAGIAEVRAEMKIVDSEITIPEVRVSRTARRILDGIALVDLA